MILYYLLLLMTRFHSDPRLGATLFDAGIVVVTPIKIVGLLTVLAACVAAAPEDAAPRHRNSLGLVWTAFAVMPVLESLAFGLPTPFQWISAMLSFSLMLLTTRHLIVTKERMVMAVRVLIIATAFGSLWLYKQYFLQHVSRAQGLEQDSNYEALTLVTAIPMAIQIAARSPYRLWRRIGIGSTLLIGIGVLLTQSRAGILAAGVMCLAFLFYSQRKIATIMLLACGVAIITYIAPRDLTQRFRSITLSGPIENGDEASSRTHYELAKAGLAMIGSHPLFGVGQGQFIVLAPHYNRALLRVAGRSYIAHDTFLQIAAESGLPVLALFLALIGLAMANFRAVRRITEPRESDLALAMQIGLIGYSVAALSITAPYVSTFWIIVFFSQNFREIAVAGAARGQPANVTTIRPSRVVSRSTKVQCAHPR